MVHWHVLLAPGGHVGLCEPAEQVQAQVARGLSPVVDPKDNWVVSCWSSGGCRGPGHGFDRTTEGECITNFADGACAACCGRVNGQGPVEEGMGNGEGKLGKGE